jgi:hypothetical protein
MNTFLRMGLTTSLLMVAGFSLFGFLASFEPPGFLVWKYIYASTGIASAAGVFGLAFGGRSQAALPA